MIASSDLPAKSRHAIELMPALHDLVAQSRDRQGGPGVEGIDQIYLATGPGSFTGLRISIAVARALVQSAAAIGKHVGVVAVPSLEVIACNAPQEARHVVVALDAKRGQVFAGRFTRDETGNLLTADTPALVDPAMFIARAMDLAGGEGVFVMGEGVDYHRAALVAGTVTELDRSLWPGRATTVHQLGWQRFVSAGKDAFTDPARLLPTYIRLPEAEELWQKRQQATGAA